MADENLTPITSDEDVRRFHQEQAEEGASLRFAEYQVGANSTAVYPRKHPIMYCALGLAEEAGEVAGKFKKALRDHAWDGTIEDLPDTVRSAIVEEMGDVLWYLSQLARELHTDLDTVARVNYSKLQARLRRGTLHGSGDNR